MEDKMDYEDKMILAGWAVMTVVFMAVMWVM